MRCQTVTRRRRPDTSKKRVALRSKELSNLWIGSRLQTRVDDYPGQTPSAADLWLERDSELDLNRGCPEGTGPLGAEWLDVYSSMTSPVITCSICARP